MIESDNTRNARMYAREKNIFKRLWNNSPFVLKLAINMDSISNIRSGDTKIRAADILRMYKDHNILFYRDEKPIVLGRSWFSKTKFIDIDCMSDENAKLKDKCFKDEIV